MAPPSINAGLFYYIAQLKKELKKRPSGYADMQQAFEEMDADGSKSLNLAELKAAFKNMKIAMSENDLRRLFTLFDRDESGMTSSANTSCALLSTYFQHVSSCLFPSFVVYLCLAHVIPLSSHLPSPRLASTSSLPLSLSPSCVLPWVML